MALYIVKPWYKKQAAPAPIYGAEWAGGSDPSWTRTDDAVGFSDPNPYYSGMSTTPSSPFDNIMPWSGMRRVTDANAGELVEIPKFYYKWTRDGVKMKLQISMEQFDGSHVSPAHADRGDGVGERDYVYVGRYHCASDYKSKTGAVPVSNITRATARTAIHNLGNNVWQNDLALWWTIRMLYLVEFANWNSQSLIGYGCGNNSSAENSGASDTMPYHTGTMKTSRNTYGVGTQYRYIEDLWGNVFDFIDGVYNSSDDVYCFTNPANFVDSTSGGTKIATLSSYGGTITEWGLSLASNLEFAILPSHVDNVSDDSYICDAMNKNGNGNILLSGGNYEQTLIYGAFHIYFHTTAAIQYYTIGARLMVLPPSRLT